jgi:hypothetical protein
VVDAEQVGDRATSVAPGEADREDHVRAPRTAARAGVVLLLGSCAAALAASPARADSGQPPVVATNWYWSQAAPTVEGNTLPVGPPAQASGVADGDLGVGYLSEQAGNPDKVAAVGFDLSAIPLGSTFSRFVVTVPLDAAATQVQSGTPELSACENIDAFADGTGPTDLAKAPPISLASCVKGTFVAAVGKAGGYVFDLTAVANDWSGGAPVNGVTLRPATSPAATPSPFTLSLLGKNGITTEATWSPAVTAAPEVPASPDLPLPAVAPAPLSGGVALPPAVPQVEGPAPLTAPLQPAPQVNPLPQVVPITPAASAYVPGSLVPSTVWWLGLLGLGGLLALTHVVLSDPMAPVVADARRRRFADVVRARVTTPAVHGAGSSTGSSTTAPRIRPA